MKFIVAITLLLLGSAVLAQPMASVIHSVCLTSDQKYLDVNMTSPILLPENPSSDNFQIVASEVIQGTPLVALFLNSNGGMFSNDRRTLRFEKEKLDEKVNKILVLENTVYVRTLNHGLDNIVIKQCQ